MKLLSAGTFVGIALAFAGGFLAYDYYRVPVPVEHAGLTAGEMAQNGEEPVPEEKTLEERIAEAYERSQNRKGVYMTSAVANDRGTAGTRLRNSLLTLIRGTELNAVVIDVKEAPGLEVGKNMALLVAELKKEDIWTIARFTVMRDNSQAAAHPDWYLYRKDTHEVWRDNHKHAWFDPARPEVQNYTAETAKKIIDIGFDEIQFDYIRFPSDGDIQNSAYPFYNSKLHGPKYKVMAGFFKHLHDELKTYKPEIILSVDLFGYVASRGNDFGVGQRLEDLKDNFDYISFMVYASHYYSGFYMEADAVRGLPKIYYPYRSATTSIVVSNHPYEVVHRSIIFAEDFLAGKFKKATTTANTATSSVVSSVSDSPISSSVSDSSSHRVRFRPFLQDFNLGADTKRGIYYDTEKVRAQIDAAEDAGASGWILWNPSNVYHADALKKMP
ncbi:MAG: putative glycoside hydrolase [bacterium]|nr:putative glycoside hydrolase [bacterium]